MQSSFAPQEASSIVSLQYDGKPVKNFSHNNSDAEEHESRSSLPSIIFDAISRKSNQCISFLQGAAFIGHSLVKVAQLFPDAQEEQFLERTRNWLPAEKKSEVITRLHLETTKAEEHLLELLEDQNIMLAESLENGEKRLSKRALGFTAFAIGIDVIYWLLTKQGYLGTVNMEELSQHYNYFIMYMSQHPLIPLTIANDLIIGGIIFKLNGRKAKYKRQSSFVHGWDAHHNHTHLEAGESFFSNAINVSINTIPIRSTSVLKEIIQNLFLSRKMRESIQKRMDDKMTDTLKRSNHLLEHHDDGIQYGLEKQTKKEGVQEISFAALAITVDVIYTLLAQHGYFGTLNTEIILQSWNHFLLFLREHFIVPTTFLISSGLSLQTVRLNFRRLKTNNQVAYVKGWDARKELVKEKGLV